MAAGVDASGIPRVIKMLKESNLRGAIKWLSPKFEPVKALCLD
jgi:hypothetical protein